MHVTVRLPPPSGLAKPGRFFRKRGIPVTSIDKAGNTAPKVVTGVVVAVFLIFLFFGDRLGAISTGSHFPSRTPNQSSLGL